MHEEKNQERDSHEYRDRSDYPAGQRFHTDQILKNVKDATIWRGYALIGEARAYCPN
jgi:hypothetical protein